MTDPAHPPPDPDRAVADPGQQPRAPAKGASRMTLRRSSTRQRSGHRRPCALPRITLRRGPTWQRSGRRAGRQSLSQRARPARDTSWARCSCVPFWSTRAVPSLSAAGDTCRGLPRGRRPPCRSLGLRPWTLLGLTLRRGLTRRRTRRHGGQMRRAPEAACRRAPRTTARTAAAPATDARGSRAGTAHTGEGTQEGRQTPRRHHGYGQAVCQAASKTFHGGPCPRPLLLPCS